MLKTETAPSRFETCPTCFHNEAELFLEAPDRFHGRRESYSLLRCKACDFVWLDKPPAVDQLGGHYGDFYDRFIGRAGEGDTARWLQRRDILTRYKKSGSLLDLGCSSGAFLSSIKGGEWDLHGIEMSPVPAETAERRSGAKVFVGDILDAPFADNSFDAITCFDVFEHLYHPREVLLRVQQWLKPGGVFYAFLPSIRSGQARVFGSYWYGLELPRHLSHFSSGSLRKLAESCGFQNISLWTSKGHLIEYSTYYLIDDLLHAMGVSRAPLAEAKEPGLLWRVTRKAFRLTALPLASVLMSLFGEGEIIEIVLRKEA